MVGGAFSKIRKSLLSRRRTRNKSDLSIKSLGAKSLGADSQTSTVSGISTFTRKLKQDFQNSEQNQTIQLPQHFYDKEKKLVALENAYVTLKKVLFKYFSLEAKQQDNVSTTQSLRRSFHEALSLRKSF